ncbi:MAG: hypothetical protein J7K87_02455 [Candidatus Aenigmarchaeota archaeon]|nr:hypothetical protein [Candidatus Aenigmarchaeota archaeon]
MKKMLLLILVLLLFIPTVLADGIYIPPDYYHWQNMVQHHQIATVDFNPDENIATIHLFISVEDLTGESRKIKWAIPFEYKPFGLNATDTVLGDFENKYKVNSTENLISDINKARRAEYMYSDSLSDFLTIFFFSPFFEIYTPVPYAVMKGGVEALRANSPGWVLSEVQQFGSTRVLVYRIFSEKGASNLVQHVGLDESVLKAFRRYDDTYLYVIELEPKSMIGQETKSYLEKICPSSYKSFISQLQRKYGYYNKDKWTEECIDECKSITPSCDYVEIQKSIEDLIKSGAERKEAEESGVVVTYKVPLEYKDGKYEFWYPLGTGEAWAKPMDDVRVYAFVPYDYKVYGVYPKPQTNETMDQWTYVWRYRNSKPSSDLQMVFTKASEKEKNKMILDAQNKKAQIKLASDVSKNSMLFVVTFFLISWFVIFLLLNKRIFKMKYNEDSLRQGLISIGAYVAGSWGISLTIVGVFVAPLVGAGLMGYYLLRLHKKKQWKKIILFVILQFVLTTILFMGISMSIYWWLDSLKF